MRHLTEDFYIIFVIVCVKCLLTPCCAGAKQLLYAYYDEKKYTLHGSKICQPTSRVCHPRLRLGWQFTRDMDCPSLFLPRCVIY